MLDVGLSVGTVQSRLPIANSLLHTRSNWNSEVAGQEMCEISFSEESFFSLLLLFVFQLFFSLCEKIANRMCVRNL